MVLCWKPRLGARVYLQTVLVNYSRRTLIVDEACTVSIFRKRRPVVQGLDRESLQRFWTFGPERGPGPGQGRQRSVRAAVGSEDPRKIDSTLHIQPGWKKRELELSQLTRVMVAVGEKMGAEIRMGKQWR